MDLLNDAGDLVATNEFTQMCYECDLPVMVNFINGERVPSTCPHDLPVVRIDC